MITIAGEDFLTAQEAAEVLAVKPATLYAYVSRGLLGSYRQGIRRRRLYRRSDVEQIIALRPSRGERGLPLASGWVDEH
jgi:citrate synthase